MAGGGPVFGLRAHKPTPNARFPSAESSLPLAAPFTLTKTRCFSCLFLLIFRCTVFGRMAGCVAYSSLEPRADSRPLRGRLINSDSLLRVLLLDNKFFYKSRSSSSPLGLISFFHLSDASPNQSFQRCVPEKNRIWPDQSKQVVRAKPKVQFYWIESTPQRS